MTFQQRVSVMREYRSLAERFLLKAEREITQ